MDYGEKINFVSELCDSVRDELIGKLSRIPENWDGHELRQWIADKFAESSFTLQENRRRYRAYKNTISTTADL